MRKTAGKTLTLLAWLIIICVVASNALAEPLRLKSVQARGGLRVRREPDINSTAVYLLEDTETVVVLFELGEWTLVAKNRGDHAPIGWACSEYLR